jgi:hypothetical protein
MPSRPVHEAVWMWSLDTSPMTRGETMRNIDSYPGKILFTVFGRLRRHDGFSQLIRDGLAARISPETSSP